MHTFKGREGTTIHHDGDVVGTDAVVLINVPNNMVEHIHANGEDWVQVSVSANDVVDFVLDTYVGGELINFIEQVPLRDVMELIRKAAYTMRHPYMGGPVDSH
jgi:hypothetical protein